LAPQDFKEIKARQVQPDRKVKSVTLVQLVLQGQQEILVLRAKQDRLARLEIRDLPVPRELPDLRERLVRSAQPGYKDLRAFKVFREFKVSREKLDRKVLRASRARGATQAQPDLRVIKVFRARPDRLVQLV
jgi:hypothetical protein